MMLALDGCCGRRHHRGTLFSLADQGCRMSTLTRWALCLLLSTLPALAGATAQIPDTIEIDGKPLPLNTNPLSAQLQARGWSPPDDAEQSTANWRGYVARWRIDGDALVLVDATIDLPGGMDDGVYKRRKRSIKAELFPGQARVVADWYTGMLIIPDGELTRYVHMGYGSSYDHYQLFRVKDGKVLEHLSMDEAAFEAYKSKSFQAFRETPEFRSALKETMSKGMTKARAIDFLQSFNAEVYLSR